MRFKGAAQRQHLATCERRVQRVSREEGTLLMDWEPWEELFSWTHSIDGALVGKMEVQTLGPNPAFAQIFSECCLKLAP